MADALLEALDELILAAHDIARMSPTFNTPIGTVVILQTQLDRLRRAVEAADPDGMVRSNRDA